MPQTVTYSGSAVASTGSSVSFSRSLAVEGVCFISVAIDPNDTVKVSLGATAAELRLLVVKPSAPADTLTFKVEGAGTARPLDQPLILGGAGAIALLGTTVTFLEIENAGTAAVTIDILVGRDPTS